MRVLLVTQYFHPEYFKSTGLAVELAKRGHQMDALVGIPNYPEGVYAKGYGLFKKRKECLDGVNVYRAFQLPRGRNASAIGLSLNYLSYVASASLWVLWWALRGRRYDAIIVFATSPITQATPAILLGRLTKTRVITWILDIWPDSVMPRVSGRMGKMVHAILSAWINWVYRKSARLLISSEGMRELVNRDADYSDKIVYYPNWSEDIREMPITKEIAMPQGFNIMMAGSINKWIGMEAIGELLTLFKERKDVHWHFVGGGSGEQWLRDFVNDNQLQETVHLYGRQPFADMGSYYSKADAMLLTLMKTDLKHFSVTVPARLQSYMSAGKPVIGMIDGGAADVVAKSRCGIVVGAGCPKELYERLTQEVLPDVEAFKRLGDNGRRYFEAHFTLDICIDHMEEILKKCNN